MAISPDCLRLATSTARWLTDTVFDGLREAVLAVDSRLKHLPIVLANAAARGCLAGQPTPASLLDASLFGLLTPASASAIEHLFAALTDVSRCSVGCSPGALGGARSPS